MGEADEVSAPLWHQGPLSDNVSVYKPVSGSPIAQGGIGCVVVIYHVTACLEKHSDNDAHFTQHTCCYRMGEWGHQRLTGMAPRAAH